MIKLSGFESSKVTDSATGKEIKVSTTARIQYRWLYRNYESELQSTRNEALNEIIGKDYAGSSGEDNVVHRFRLGSSSIETKSREVAEIRKFVPSDRARAFNFFLAVERVDAVYILAVKQSWKSPKYTKTYGYTKKKI
jgi:hypothetical protein